MRKDPKFTNYLLQHLPLYLRRRQRRRRIVRIGRISVAVALREKHNAPERQSRMILSCDEDMFIATSYIPYESARTVSRNTAS